jgi:hypothetical protein
LPQTLQACGFEFLDACPWWDCDDDNDKGMLCELGKSSCLVVSDIVDIGVSEGWG